MGEASAERHVAHSFAGAAFATDIVGGPLDALNDARVGAAAITAKHLDGDQAGSLGNTIGGAASRSRDVGTVAVSIRVAGVGKVGTKGCTPAEVRVRGEDTSVDDVS